MARPAEQSAFSSCTKVGGIAQGHSSGIQQTNAAEQAKFRNNSNLLSLSARAMTQRNT
jgi:ribose 5-phosphate isomerase RpiB